MSKKMLLLGFLLYVGSQVAVAMSVDEAYRAIPHQKTDFDRHTARMRADETFYLDTFFRLVNAAIVEKVQTQQWLSSGGTAGKSTTSYRTNIVALLADFDRLTIPAGLHEVQKQVVAAVRLQAEYFADWAERTGEGEHYRFSASDKRIAASSHLLISAYKRLIKRYPQATRNNRKAFYDHLCALDFI
jgi:hypothetical protein